MTLSAVLSGERSKSVRWIVGFDDVERVGGSLADRPPAGTIA